MVKERKRHEKINGEEVDRGQKPWPPGPLMHLPEKRVPRPRLEVTTPVFIKAMARTTVFLGYV